MSKPVNCLVSFLPVAIEGHMLARALKFCIKMALYYPGSFQPKH